MKAWNGKAGRVVDLKDVIARRSAASPEYRKAVETARAVHQMARELAQARKAEGLSQRALAKKMGTSQAQVHRLESGTHAGSSIETVAAAAAALNRQVRISFEPLPRTGRRTAPRAAARTARTSDFKAFLKSMPKGAALPSQRRPRKSSR